ncbi:MAG: VIT domain-containing protein [Myxococcota bacterium]
MAALVLAGCAQHATPLEYEFDAPEDTEDTFVYDAFEAEPDGARSARRCQDAQHGDAMPIDADAGWDRPSLRAETADGLRELPLQETTYETLVVGTVAETVVTQVFANPLEEPIEAVYAFPLHERAAVDDYWIHIGDRSIHGELHRRAEAKEIYEQAKADGHRAGLLEQERPNLFTQSVANIQPGESIEVKMHVVQPLGIDDGRATLTLPTVVGPRFIPGSPTGHAGVGTSPDTDQVPDASRITPPIMAAEDQGCARLAISVDIESGLGVRALRSANHAVEQNAAHGVTTVELANGRTVPNRDFELSWSFHQDEAAADVSVQPREDGGGTFTLTIAPPVTLDAEDAVARDLIFVVDNSGSMSGQPMKAAKSVMRRAIREMGPNDRFSVLRFSESASALAPGLLENTAATRKRGLAYVDDMHGMGGTRMLEGIRAALSLAQSSDRIPMVLFLTDGWIGNDRQIFEAVHEDLGSARIFGLGVGDAPNRFLLDGMSTVGRGSTTYVGIGDSGREQVDRFYDRIATPALQDVTVDWGTLPVQGVVPQRLPDLFVGEPLVLYGHFDRPAKGTVTIRGTRGGAAVEIPVEVDFGRGVEGTGLDSMWARTTIEELVRSPIVYGLDEDTAEARVEQATKLALEHSVLMHTTAFVAVDDSETVDGASKRVAVPVESVRGTEVGESYGVGGLGLVGTGRGGGGTGSGTIGLGNTGLIGKGGGGGTGSGYGRGSGRGFGGRGKRVPRVRQAKATVTGSLDKDIIRRIVRAHINKYRACYETMLASDSKRSVRVVLTLLVAADGTVTASIEQEAPDDLEATFYACVDQAADSMKFPKPPGGGTVKIRYPLVFSPG